LQFVPIDIFFAHLKSVIVFILIIVVADEYATNAFFFTILNDASNLDD
jgi:hypothetical protein